ncbi:MAG: purine-nucleoside phosphorylase [Thiotrichales bacterium]|nr:MAG: purine-nucleoside phosphorylase [Thiotrichales bacterium]
MKDFINLLNPKLPEDFKPKIALVLGSGLNAIVDDMEVLSTVPYKDIPILPTTNVKGHVGNLLFGYLHGVPIVCMQGRFHFYEGISRAVIMDAIGMLHDLGCKTLLLTNASGSLKKAITAGSLFLVKDHINLQLDNPLIGADQDKAVEFIDLHNAYDANLRSILKRHADKLQIPLQEGVYFAVTGPNYETFAEASAFSKLGGDVIGMSTVPEVLVAKKYSMQVAVLTVVTNYSIEVDDSVASHDEVLKNASLASGDLSRLLINAIQDINNCVA